MINEASVRQLAADIRNDHTASWFWVIGAGVSAAVTGNAREATWPGMVAAMVENTANNNRDNELLAHVAQKLSDWEHDPKRSNFWQVIDALEEVLGERGEGAKRLIYQRLSRLELADHTLFECIVAFDWPLATTNLDNLLCAYLRTADPTRIAQPLLPIEMTEPDARRWLQKSRRDVLHLHGHLDRQTGLLFSRADYARYCHESYYRRILNEIFKGRPVFVGCGGTLTDPNIQWLLEDRSEWEAKFSAEPIVLLRDGETLKTTLPVRPLEYGSDYPDLPEFLAAVFNVVEGRAPTPHPSPEPAPASSAWMAPYCARLAEEYALLRLPDFSAGDRDVQIPLDDVYVSLVLDYRDSQERLEEARMAHHQGSAEEALAKDPLPRAARAYRNEASLILLDELLRTQPVSVVLGDPGTGKTTLVKWLVRQAALARGQSRQKIVVEAVRIDSEAPAAADPKTVGPAWLPIAVSMARYSAERADLEVSQSHRLLRFLVLSVVRTCQEQGHTTSVEEVEKSLVELAASGLLLVALDGLDEIPQTQRREDIVVETEHFMRWLFDLHGDRPRSSLVRAGNRLIITSRLAGYKHAPFSVNIAHYQVEPMRPASVQRLVRNLFQALRQALRESSPKVDATARLDELEPGLLRVLSDPSKQLSSLAATPVLASAIFALYVGEDGVLPRDRRQIYAKFVDLLLSREARRLGNGEDSQRIASVLRHAFQDLAFEAFQAPDGILIPAKELLARMQQVGTTLQLSGLQSIPENGLGLLVPKAPGAYGFIHRTFQEYLCAEYLTRPGQSFDELLHVAGFASWREPVRLGFMIWATRASPGHEAQHARVSEVQALVRTSRLSNGLRPLSLAVAAVAEADDPPRELNGLIAAGVITALTAVRSTVPQPPRDLVAALSSFIQCQDGKVAMEEALENALLESGRGDSTEIADRAAVSATLITALDLFNTNLISALQAVEPRDSQERGWPITVALLDLMTPKLPTSKQGASSTPETQSSSLKSLDRTYVPRALARTEATPATNYFTKNQPLLDRLRKDSGWARLLTVLLGGQRDYNLKTYLSRYGDLASFLQMDDGRRQELRAWIPPQWRALINQEEPDFVFAIAQYLDSVAVPAIRSFKIEPWLNPKGFLYAAPSWLAVQGQLLQSAAQANLSDPILRAAVRLDGERLAREHLPGARKAQRRVEDAALRGIHCITETVATRGMTCLTEDSQQRIFLESLCAIAARLGSAEFIERFSKSKLGGQATRVLQRERSALMFHLARDDRLYSAAVWADTRAKTDGALLVQIARSPLLWSSDQSYLPRLPFAYPEGTFCDQIVDWLTIIEQCPKRASGMLLDSFKHLQRSTPDLYQEIASELLATMSRIEDLDARERSAEACWTWLVQQPATPCTLRGRIRLLPILDAQQRSTEERYIFRAAVNLEGGGVQKAQIFELLARRGAFVPAERSLHEALEVGGLAAAEAVSLRIRVLVLIAEPLRKRVFEDAVRLAQSVDLDERMRLLRGLAEHALWVGADAIDFGSLSQDGEEPGVSSFVQGRHGDALAALVDGPLKSDEFFGGESFAPVVAHAKLEDAAAGSAQRYLPGSGISKLIGAKDALEHGDERETVNLVIGLSVNNPPGLVELWRSFGQKLADGETSEQVLAVLTAAETGVSPLNIAGLVGALTSKHSALKSRARALLVPPGHGMHPEKSSAAAQGLSVLLEFARQKVLHQSRHHVRVQIGWRLEKIELDDPDIVHRLIQALRDNMSDRTPALALLHSLSHATIRIVELLAEQFEFVDPEAQRSLLIFFSRYVARNMKTATLPKLTLPNLVPDSVNRALLIYSPEEFVQALCAEPADPAVALQSMQQQHGRGVFDLFRAQDLERIRALGKAFFSMTTFADEEDEAYVRAAESLLAVTDGAGKAADLLFHLLRQCPEDDCPEWIRGDLLVILAAAADHKPATVVACFNHTERRRLLADAATSMNSFPARRAAFLLMGALFATPRVQPHAEEISALTCAAFDVPSVIDGALSAARQVRGLSDFALNKMFTVLFGDNTECSALAGRILVSIANSQEVSQATRDRIMTELNGFVESPLSARTAYFGYLDVFTPPAMTIREMLLTEFEAGGEGVRILNSTA